MTIQFDLGSKHLDNKKQANAVISEIKSDNTKETVKELMSRSYGIMPSKSTAYNDYLGLVASLEEIAKVAPAAASVLVDQVIAQELLSKYGNCEATASTGEIYAVLCAEPAISDIKNLNTKATKNGSTWHLQGKKLVRNDHLLADKYLIFALDDENLLRVFMLSESEINIHQITKSIAGTTVNLNQIELNMDIPESANVATIADCYEKNLSIARTLIAAVAVGIAHSAIVTSINTVKETKGCDGILSNTQSVQFTLADMYAEMEAGRMLTYYSADLIDNNKANVKFATIAKVQSSDSAGTVSMNALQLLGNIGYLANNEFADVIRYALDSQTRGGTNRVQKNQIYQYMLARK